MSFRNTHTPRLSEIAAGGRKHQLPKRANRNNSMEFYMTPELEAEFVRLYPVTINRKMMRLFGISFSVLQRFKRQLGLEKQMPAIRRKQAEITKRICEENGYYNSLRGKRPSEACMEASRRLRATGWVPITPEKRNSAEFKARFAAGVEKRKETYRREQLRVYNGLEQRTKLHIPYYPYGKRRTSFRHCCKKAGYMPGSRHDERERWIIYYTPDTQRSPIRERHGIAMGFRFEPMKQTT